jgi:hypothetical protein
MSSVPGDHFGQVLGNQAGTTSLVVSSTSGLCNRLLTLAGAMRIAEKTGRRLVLYWPCDTNLNCRFESLFENPIEQFDARHVYDLLHTQNGVSIYQTERGKVNRLHYRSVVRRDPSPVIVVKGWGAPALRWEGGAKPKDRARPYLKALVPVAALREAIARPPVLEDAIGVHIRRGDDPQSFAGSRDQDFLTIMRRLVERKPDVRFQLATDDAATEQRVRDEFPDRVHTLAKTVFGPAARHSVEGMQEAVVDLYRLARTRAVLGNHRSSFSTVAALLGSGRLVVANAKTARGRRGGKWEALLA